MRRVLLGLLLMSIVGSSSEALPTFDPNVTVDTTTTISSGGTLDWHGRTSVKRRSDGALLLLYRTGTGHNTGDAQLNLRFSDDNGATWTAANTKLGGGAVSGFPMNPAVGNVAFGMGWLIVAPSGRLLLQMNSASGALPGADIFGTYQSVSDDGGESWSTSTFVDWSGVSDPLLVYPSNDDFIVDGVLYTGVAVYADDDLSPAACALMKSEDDGSTWSFVGTVVADDEVVSEGFGAGEFGMEYLGNSTILAMIRDGSHTHSYQRISTDLGLTWGTLTDVTSVVGIAARQRVYTASKLMGLEGWWNDNRLLMVGFVQQTPGDSQDRRNAVWLGMWDRNSRTATWSGPQYVDTTDEDGGYGDLFYAGSTGQFSASNYKGTLNAASVKQYDLTVSWS